MQLAADACDTTDTTDTGDTVHTADACAVLLFGHHLLLLRQQKTAAAVCHLWSKPFCLARKPASLQANDDLRGKHISSKLPVVTVAFGREPVLSRLCCSRSYCRSKLLQHSSSAMVCPLSGRLQLS